MTSLRNTSVTVVGPGNLGRVLALALAKAGVRVDEVVSRPEKGSQQRAGKIASACGAAAASVDSARLAARVIWICVPDDAIRETAGALARRKIDWRGKVVLHASGALAASELAALKRKGAHTGSAHPMNTFVATSRASLKATPLALEGDKDAVRAAAALAERLGADAFVLKTKDKALYHALGSFSSPLLVALLAMAEKVGRSAGLRDPRRVNERILMQTLENYRKGSAASAFSGPLFRGDVKTIERHLRALKRVKGGPAVYRALAAHAVEALPGKNKDALRRALK